MADCIGLAVVGWIVAFGFFLLARHEAKQKEKFCDLWLATNPWSAPASSEGETT